MIKCEYCNRSFKQESRLETHMCENKRRWFNRDFSENKIGLELFDLYYRLALKSKPKTYDDFVKSKYFTGFVKLASFCINSKSLDHEAYLRWLVKNEIKMKSWCSDETYHRFVKDFMKKETIERALERFVEHASSLDYFHSFWETASGYLIADWVEVGKISPWILISSERAKARLQDLNQEQIEKIANCIDFDYWQRKKNLNPIDIE